MKGNYVEGGALAVEREKIRLQKELVVAQKEAHEARQAIYIHKILLTKRGPPPLPFVQGPPLKRSNTNPFYTMNFLDMPY